MLASGKRRACCFDRSGIYSKSLDAPKSAEPAIGCHAMYPQHRPVRTFYPQKYPHV